MSAAERDRLLRLLPRVLRARDTGALEAVVDTLAARHEELRDDVARAYDDLFIATCAPSVVPLLAEEVGVSGLGTTIGPGVGDRAWVGRMTRLRRDKGTLAAIARGAAAATGWAVYAQDGRAALARTQALLDVAPYAGRTHDLRRPGALHEPWSRAARTVAVSGRTIRAGMPARRLAARGGHPAPATVAITVWRLHAYAVDGRRPVPATGASDAVRGRAFRFDPLGRDTHLFAPGHAARGRDAPLPGELPVPLTRAALAAAEHPPLRIRVGGADPPVAIVARDLGAWRPGHLPEGSAAVDPERGRFVLADEPAEPVDVSYAYGFAGELGAGPYGGVLAYAPLAPAMTLERVDGTTGESLVAALSHAVAEQPGGAVVVDDSLTHLEPGQTLDVALPAGGELRLTSAPDAAPVLAARLVATVPAGARLEVGGIVLAGGLEIRGEGELALEHCTLASHDGAPALAVGAGISAAAAFTLCGAVRGDASAHLSLRSSLVDGPLDGDATVELEHVTVLGTASARALYARDCLLRGRVEVRDDRRGVVASSYLPSDSVVPHTHGCSDESDGRPRFTSTRYGDPAFGQLALDGPASIARGATGGGELGAFNWLQQPARFERLPIVLQELLGAGIGASVEYRT